MRRRKITNRTDRGKRKTTLAMTKVNYLMTSKRSETLRDAFENC
jgi:hypothetical protein